MKKAFLAITLFLTASFSFAAMVDKSETSISVVYVNNNGSYLMKVSDVDQWLNIGSAGDPKADALYSTALAAKLSGQSAVWVRYWTNDSDPSQYPAVGIISIH